MWLAPSGLGTHEPPAGFYVQSGCVSVCRGDRAAADRTCSRTGVSPGRVLDTSESENKSGKKKTEIKLGPTLGRTWPQSHDPLDFTVRIWRLLAINLCFYPVFIAVFACAVKYKWVGCALCRVVMDTDESISVCFYPVIFSNMFTFVFSLVCVLLSLLECLSFLVCSFPPPSLFPNRLWVFHLHLIISSSHKLSSSSSHHLMLAVQPCVLL